MSCPPKSILPKGTLAPNSGNKSKAMTQSQTITQNKSCGLYGVTYGPQGNAGTNGVDGATGATGIGDSYHTFSSDALTLSAEPVTSAFAITVGTGLGYIVNQPVVLVSATDDTNYLNATVSAYDSVSGQIT